MTPAEFIAKWRPVELSERAASQEHFLDLCRLLGQPTPAAHDATGAEYAFEKGVAVTAGASAGAQGERGFADVWWKNKFAWEYKRRGKYGDLADAYRQLCQYREALGNPPLLIVSDIARTEIHTNFTGTAKQVHTILLEEMDQPAALGLLRRVFTDPASFCPVLRAETVNEYIATAKAFLNWCVTQGRLAANPLANVTPTDETQKKRKRRALALDEARRLLAVAGPRHLVYWVAMTTGLRRSELADLRWDDLHIGPGVPRPYIALRAEATKSRRDDSVPLRMDVAAALNAARPRGVGPDENVFDGIPEMDVFRKDLKAAGIPESDEEKRRVDFHSLRRSLATLLAKSGATPRTAMEVMRHTDLRLTMSVYCDPTLLDTSTAVEQLPDLTAADDAASALRTGTDGLPLPDEAAGQAMKVLPRSTTRPGASGHFRGQGNGPGGPRSGIPRSSLAPHSERVSNVRKGFPALSRRLTGL